MISYIDSSSCVMRFKPGRRLPYFWVFFSRGQFILAALRPNTVGSFSEIACRRRETGCVYAPMEGDLSDCMTVSLGFLGPMEVSLRINPSGTPRFLRVSANIIFIIDQ